MELNYGGLRSMVFHTSDGREMLATLTGEPGARVVEFFQGGRCPIPYGRAALPLLLRDPTKKGGWRCILAPRGDLKNCSDVDLISIDLDLAAQLAAWAQSVALGRAEGECE